MLTCSEALYNAIPLPGQQVNLIKIPAQSAQGMTKQSER